LVRQNGLGEPRLDKGKNRIELVTFDRLKLKTSGFGEKA
jgi:hypothetical protein